MYTGCTRKRNIIWGTNVYIGWNNIIYTVPFPKKKKTLRKSVAYFVGIEAYIIRRDSAESAGMICESTLNNKLVIGVIPIGTSAN